MATHDAFWTDLDGAKTRILERLAHRGVTRVEYVVGFGQARGLEQAITQVFDEVHKRSRGVFIES